MYAIVDIAGFQEKVSKGDKLKVMSLESEEGKNMTFDKVLMLADGASLKVGAPYVVGASIEVKVLSHGKGDKIRVVKAHRRKRYRRVKGHRQGYSEVEVVKING